ncbi:MAG: DUF975 family protein [Candidatus Egerieousia sp.]
MIKRATEIRSEARLSLKGNWGMAVVTFLVFGIITGVIGIIPWIGWILSLLALPLSFGLAVAFLNNARTKQGVKVETLFEGFYDYGRIFGTMLLQSVYTFLWSLLLVIPGIIKQFSYAMTPFILKDNPELKFNGAIEKSMAMMRGYKWKLFCLCLSFIGWAILCVLTLGIGYLWLGPYIQQSLAHFYLEVKAEYERNNGEAPAASAE